MGSIAGPVTHELFAKIVWVHLGGAKSWTKMLLVISKVPLV